MIYLASPYSSKDPQLEEERFEAACKVTAHLITEQGLHVISPIAHTRPIAKYGLPGDWAFWKEYDTNLINRCDELYVLRLPGWKESVGVQAEIEIARKGNKPITFVDPI